MQIEARAVLFDSDGVLIDSHRQVAAAWRRLADEFDLDYDVLVTELFGVRAEDTLAKHLHDGVLERAIDRLEDIEVGLASTVQVLPGALDLLDQLPAGSWTIVTSGSTRLAEARWRGAGIPTPPRVITADSVTAGKPDPEPYLVAAELLGVDPGQAVVFEDSSAGGEAGRAAGAAVVAVGDQPWSSTPTARIEDLSQVSVTGRSSGFTLQIGS
jgi:sugar-phosphatase